LTLAISEKGRNLNKMTIKFCWTIVIAKELVLSSFLTVNRQNYKFKQKNL